MTNRMYQLKREHNSLMWANEINEALNPKQEGQTPEKRRRTEDREIKTETGQTTTTTGASTSYQDKNQDTPKTRWNHKRSNPLESIHEYEMALARSLKENNNIINEYQPAIRPMGLHTNTNQQIPIILILTTPQQPDFVMTDGEEYKAFWKKIIELQYKRGW
jgi:hypothetical protein